jgi:broad specificity phosphatase PhoE
VKLYFIRHGSTDLNDQKLLRGWLDPPLNDLGSSQGEMLADYLKEEDISKIYSSDLIRARDTADMIGDSLGLPFETTQALRPINFGDLQGQPLEKIQPKLNWIMKQWEFDPNITVPNGESFKSFQDRTYNFITNVINTADEEDGIFFVTHVRVCLYIAQVTINGFQKLKGKEIDRLDTLDILPGNYLMIERLSSKDIFRVSGLNQIDQSELESEKSEVISAAGT